MRMARAAGPPRRGQEESQPAGRSFFGSLEFSFELFGVFLEFLFYLGGGGGGGERLNGKQVWSWYPPL